ncbi:hypothetical protein SAMN05216197_103180 [Pseudomonas graminis]|uniref:Uncharacterized protein n=1 Tax=Pseudomonas graminis TaxID=158627 RepID=A0A1I0AA70_9PSED|nr:hypothetical protein SAMN05216197_103180 [Pseudomonas graminis]
MAPAPAPSRLKPVPLSAPGIPCRTGFSREAFALLLLCFCSSNTKSSDTANRDLGAGRTQTTRSGPSRMDAARAPLGHGCPFGAGPRSVVGVREPDEVGPNQEQAPLVTWGAFPSNSPKAKQSAPRQTLVILRILILILKTNPPYRFTFLATTGNGANNAAISSSCNFQSPALRPSSTPAASAAFSCCKC